MHGGKKSQTCLSDFFFNAVWSSCVMVCMHYCTSGCRLIFKTVPRLQGTKNVSELQSALDRSFNLVYNFWFKGEWAHEDKVQGEYSFGMWSDHMIFIFWLLYFFLCMSSIWTDCKYKWLIALTLRGRERRQASEEDSKWVWAPLHKLSEMETF